MSSMVRINAAIRDHIIKALLDKKYVEQNLELQRRQEEADEAQKNVMKMAYEAAFTASQRKVLEEAPQGYFPEVSGVRVRIADKNDPDNYADENIQFGENKRVFYRNSYHIGMFAAVIDNDHPYIVALKKLKNDTRELGDMVSTLRQKKAADSRRIETIISSVTTIKRLQEVWPEVIDYLPEEVSGAGGGLPAHMIADINKEFGLDKSGDEAA